MISGLRQQVACLWSAVACYRLGLAKLASPFAGSNSMLARQQAAASQGASKLAHSKDTPLENIFEMIAMKRRRTN